MKPKSVRSLLVFGARFKGSETLVDRNGENVTFASYEDAIRILQEHKTILNGAWEVGFLPSDDAALEPKRKTITEILNTKHIPWHGSHVAAEDTFNQAGVTVEKFFNGHAFCIEMQC